ncbi:unnamed protein product, partial [Staurois parvus]
MTLGRKGLTSGAIKGLTVCYFTVCCVCALHCKHTPLYASIQISVQQLTEERSVLFAGTPTRKCKI